MEKVKKVEFEKDVIVTTLRISRIKLVSLCNYQQSTLGRKIKRF